jgi:cytochrome c-type biogenesis protein CcmH
MARSILILSLLIFGSPTLWAADLTDAQEQEARAIEGLLIAPCCWRQPVSAHFSPASDEVRADVRERLASGSTREEILDSYVAEYGEKILAKPTTKGFNALAYYLPAIFLLIGAAVAAVVIKKLRPGGVGSAARPAAVKVKSKYAEQLDRELWG